MSLDEKQSLHAELLERLQAEYETLLAAQRATMAGATHEEAKPENDKDTRALEQSYLARGQAERVAMLQSDLGALRQMRLRDFSAEGSKISISALVTAEDEHGQSHEYFLVPAGAGETLSCLGRNVKVVTPSSPLGRALALAELGDDVSLVSPTGKRSLSITAVS